MVPHVASANPSSARTATESGNDRDQAKISRVNPYIVPDASMNAPLRRMSPTRMRTTMPAMAPAPMLERSSPRPSAPAPRTSRAKMVINAWLCPKIEKIASIASIAGRIALART